LEASFGCRSIPDEKKPGAWAPGLRGKIHALLRNASPCGCPNAQCVAEIHRVDHAFDAPFSARNACGARATSDHLAACGGSIERNFRRPFDGSTGHPADVVRSGKSYVAVSAPKMAAPDADCRIALSELIGAAMAARRTRGSGVSARPL
jgi:hypothetical protein